MKAANLQLSPEEMRLVTDPGWILTKNSIIKKVVGLFAGLGAEYRALLDGPGSAEALYAGDAGLAGSISPKISKGENYRGLPYVMLDYPRLFGREDVLAIRTFFWWGHAFSVTLHLKGEYRARYWPVLQRRWRQLADAGFCVGVSEDEWAHEHVPENYRPIISADDLGAPDPGLDDDRGLDDDPQLDDDPRLAETGRPGSPEREPLLPGEPSAQMPFLKLSSACGLERWDEAHEVLLGLFRVLVDVLKEGGPVEAARH